MLLIYTYINNKKTKNSDNLSSWRRVLKRRQSVFTMVYMKVGWLVVFIVLGCIFPHFWKKGSSCVSITLVKRQNR